MNKKKIIAAALLLNLALTTHMPAMAFVKKHNVIQAQVNEYKFKNVNVDWWKNYNDAYLEYYIVKAVNESPNLQIATLRVEEAKQMVKLQFSKELPSAGVGILPAMYKMPGVQNTDGLFAVPMYVNYEADIFLKNHDKTKSAKKNYEISQLNERAAYIAIASQIGTAYFNIVKLDKLISLQEEIIKDRKEIYELMKIRNRQGITSTADETRAQKAYVMAVADLSDLKKTRNILLNALAVMIGETPNNANELKRISYDALTVQKALPEEIHSDVITQRPDYIAAEKQIEKAGIDVRIAKKEFLPSVNILGLASFNSLSSYSTMNWSNAIAGLGGAVMLPLFTGGAKVANLKLKKNQYEQILQNYYKTNLTAIQEVNDALSSLKLDNEKYKNNLSSYNMQKKDYGYTQARYNQGIISNLDLLQQKETLLNMDKLVVSSKTDFYIDQISLYKAVGGTL